MALSTANAAKNGLAFNITCEGSIPMIISSRVMPGPITDTIPIVYAETAVPGLPYTPINPVRLGNNRLAFQVPIINRLKTLGNQDILNQIELLRNTDQSFISILSSAGIQFKGPPRVVYNYGTHKPPLEYIVRKADFTHNGPMPPRKDTGFSRYTIVDFELEMDCTSYLYEAWQAEIRVMALAGIDSSINNLFGSGRSY